METNLYKVILQDAHSTGAGLIAARTALNESEAQEQG